MNHRCGVAAGGHTMQEKYTAAGASPDTMTHSGPLPRYHPPSAAPCGQTSSMNVQEDAPHHKHLSMFQQLAIQTRMLLPADKQDMMALKCR
jgi:hypothetical protein